MKNWSIYLLVLLMILTGCSAFYDLYPAKLPTASMQYVSKDPNSIKWPCIAKVKELKNEVTNKHTFTQTELSMLLSKDNAYYANANEQTTIMLTSAEAERQKLIGTIEQPGYLLGVLLPLIGGVAGRFITTLTHYSEQELQTEITKAKNGSNAG